LAERLRCCGIYDEVLGQNHWASADFDAMSFDLGSSE
jgi:hypothetical protein